MELAARQLLRAIRGDRSQVAFARRLGYRGNPIADWEAGRRTPTIGEALRACRRVGIDVPAAFARFHTTVPANPFVAQSISDWIDSLRGSTSMVELGKRLNCSRYAVGRWLSGRAHPRVHEFLRLLDAITGRACDLVAELVAIEKVPSLEQAHTARAAARALAHDEPWTEAILRVLESRPYHAGQVAELLGIDEATERRCIRKLLLSGVVHRRGRQLDVKGELTVDTRAAATLKAHWSKVAQERLLEPRPSDLFTYNVLSAAPEDITLIRERLRATFREIRTIVANSRSTEGVALVNLQLVDWSES